MSQRYNKEETPQGWDTRGELTNPEQGYDKIESIPVFWESRKNCESLYPGQG